VARSGAKTVRFTRVVERSGQPHVHTLWLPPDKDPELKRAREAHRVMTLETRPNGAKTDVGHVGFDDQPGANEQFLIFPKSLKPFEGARVIGIKFDLVEQPKLAPAQRARRVAPRRRKSTPTSHPARADREERARTAPESPPAAEPKREPVRTPSPAPVRTSAPPAASKRTEPPEKPKPSPAHAALIREVRAAMKELHRGQAVAAYQRLEHALAQT
jgi:hypothetical protein